MATKDLVEHVGFTPHLHKSTFEPTQIIVFLGFTLNSLTVTVKPTHEKIIKTRQYCLGQTNPYHSGFSRSNWGTSSQLPWG